MAATYRAVMVTKAGGPEVLQIVELPVESPGPGQMRVRVRAAGVGSTVLIMLAGKYRYAPRSDVSFRWWSTAGLEAPTIAWRRSPRASFTDATIRSREA
jgi:NADPH:quinone reductase-like Zn-dependent oxidoreductase